MLMGSIVRRELRTLPRGKWFYHKRVAVIVVGGMALLWGLWLGRTSTTVGWQIFMSISLSSLVAALVLAGTAASSGVMREKEDRTLGLLFLADLSVWDFIIGKLFTALFSTVMAILSVLPLFILTVSLGGISIGQVLIMISLLLSMVFLVAVFGQWSAVVCATDRTANALMLLVAFLYLVYLPATLAILDEMNKISVDEWVYCIVSPFVGVTALSEGKNEGYVGLAICWNLLLGLPILLWSAWLIPRKILASERPSWMAVLRQRLRVRRRIGRWFAVQPVEGNPMTWKDLTYFHGGMHTIWLKFGLSVLLVTSFLTYLFIRVDEIKGEEMAGMATGVFAIFSLAVVGLAGAAHCGSSFNRERRNRVLDLVLTTDMTDGEILWGKLRAVLISIAPWAGLATVCGIFVVSSESVFGHDRVEVVVYIGSEFLSMAFGYGMMAFWLSLRYRRSIGFGMALLGLLLYNTFGRFIFISMVEEFVKYADGDTIVNVMVGMDCVFHGLMGAFFLRHMVFNFRTLALSDTAG